MLQEANIPVVEPRLYSEYAPDYFAVFFSDLEGIRLEITNYRLERRQRHNGVSHDKRLQPAVLPAALTYCPLVVG